jgi:ADP-ribose pyrophosphatase
VKKTIFKGRIVELNVETDTLPNGATAEMELIHHPGAAAVVPLRNEGTVLMIRQYRHAIGGYLYEIPAGKLHPGEDPRDCASRELEEEIGFRASSLELLSSVFTTPGFTDEVIHLYVGTGLTRGTQNLGHDEVVEVMEMSMEQALALIRDGTIRDAKTIIGLQLVYLSRRAPQSRRDR